MPQDISSLKSHKELCYAIDDNGNYQTALSSGWAPKAIALNNTIQEIEERIADARERVLSAQTSPIEYYMELHKMDVSILASYMGIWPWFVKRHFKPKVFKRLNSRVLQKYAHIFGISVEELKEMAKA